MVLFPRVFSIYLLNILTDIIIQPDIRTCHIGDICNSVDPDQMPQNVASDQGPHCLHKM